jgi:hypothetical protein
MPFSDDKMPFYALGINIARQVGGQTGFTSMLSPDEIELVLSGFSDSIRGTATQEDMVGTESNLLVSWTFDSHTVSSFFRSIISTYYVWTQIE